MRHDAWRHEAASYPLRGELAPRYTDVDVWQHMNNTALISMHGEAVQAALRGVLGPDAWRAADPALACTRFATDFLAEAHYPAPLQWGARVLGIDADGLRVATALFQHERCVGLHDATLAGWSGGRIVGPGAACVDALRAAGVEGADRVDPAHASVTSEGAPHDADHFPWRTTVGLRFADNDARRLASDQWLARCAEQVRVEFLNEVFGGQRRTLGGMLVAHVALRWLHRGAGGKRWEAACGISHLGERSIAVRGAMFEAGRCVAVCDAVMVIIDRESRRSAPMAGEARVLLEPYRLRQG